MARNRPDIIYIHHGHPRVYQTVNAIVKSGYSCRYLSGYYYRENGWPETFLRWLPTRWTANILAKMKRRHLQDLSPDIIERSWVLEALLMAELAFKDVPLDFLMLRNWYMDVRGAIRVLTLRPKVVISCDSHALYALRAAKRIGAIAILDQVVGHVDAANKILSEEKKLRPEIGSAFSPTSQRIVRRCIREVQEADYIFAPSKYVGDSLLPFGADPDRIFLLPYGVDLDMFVPTPAPPVPPFRLLFAGHIGIRKGAYYLLEATKQAAIPGVQVVLLGNIEGDGKWLDKYRDLLVHHRHLPHPEIPAIFATAHIYVFPSLHEGSTVSIYEAMASGLPVVTTLNSGSIVRDGTDGFIVPLRDIPALKDRIERLYNDATLREAMGRNAAAHAANYSWNDYARRIGKILGDLLDGHNTAGG